MRQVVMALGVMFAVGSAHALEWCELSMQDLNLGRYVWTEHSPAQQLLAANVKCTADTPQDVTISAQIPVFTAGGVREMVGPGGQRLRYHLDIRGTAAAVDQPWGDGSGGTVVFTRTLNTLTNPEVDIIPTLTIEDGQRVPSGTYSDSLTITVSIVAPP